MSLNLSVEQVLTTTRAVRNRLDVSRKVPRDLIETCLEMALQAPNGSNQNVWRWLVVDDPAAIKKVAGVYKAVVQEVSQSLRAKNVGVPGEEKIIESSLGFLDKVDQVPAFLIPLMAGRTEGKPVAAQAAMWGSIIQAVWSFCLAAREHGLGTAWTTAGLLREKEIADILGIPFDRYTQVGLLPIGYTIGTDFKKAWRKPVSEVLTYNKF